jgi:hypothetical protein
VNKIKRRQITCSGGALTPRIQELKMFMVIFSPECGLRWNGKDRLNMCWLSSSRRRIEELSLLAKLSFISVG